MIGWVYKSNMQNHITRQRVNEKSIGGIKNLPPTYILGKS